MEYKKIYNTVKNVCFQDVIYADGKWIFTALGMNPKTEVEDGSYHICSTSDLQEWNDTIFYTELPNNYIQIPRIAYGNGIYIATVANELFISSDLKKWEHISIYNLINVNATTNIKFFNGQFVIVTFTQWVRGDVVDHYEGHILTSKNGKNWTLNSSFNDKALLDITYFNKNYYIIGTNGFCAKSSNLTNWIDCKLNTSEHIKSITSGASGLIALAENKITLFSSDGSNWQKVFTENTKVNLNVEYGNGVYMIMQNQGSFAYTLDGKNFEYLYEAVTGAFFGMTFSQEKQMFIVCGNWWAYDLTGSIISISISRELPSTSSDEELIYIYDLNFNFLGTIDSFKSLRWRRKYFEAGEFEIVIHPDKNLLDNLKINMLILRNNYIEAGIIESLNFGDNGNDEDLIIKGRFLSSILDRRIVKKIIKFSSTSIDGMKILLNEMTPFPKFEIEQTTMQSKYIEFQCSYKYVYDYLIKLSKYSGIGFRIVPNLENKVFIFENYQGVDRSSEQNINEKYSFSDNEHNIDNADLIISNANKVNYVLVGGQGEGDSRILAEVKKDNSSGFDLYEKFVDSKNQSNQNLSTEVYKQILIQDGKDALEDEINDFSFDIYDVMDDYKDKFDLGDIVDIYKENWDYKVKERIIEIEEVIEDGKKSISIKTGTAIPEIFNDD